MLLFLCLLLVLNNFLSRYALLLTQCKPTLRCADMLSHFLPLLQRGTTFVTPRLLLPWSIKPPRDGICSYRKDVFPYQNFPFLSQNNDFRKWIFRTSYKSCRRTRIVPLINRNADDKTYIHVHVRVYAYRKMYKRARERTFGPFVFHYIYLDHLLFQIFDLLAFIKKN